MQQDRGLPAALWHGIAMLAGILAVAASQVVATASASTGASPSPFSALLPLFAAAPVVDLSPDDDETARELKARFGTSDGAAVASERLNDIHFFQATTPAASSEAAGTSTFSLGPRAPPPARNFDLRRLAWQA